MSPNAYSRFLLLTLPLLLVQVVVATAQNVVFSANASAGKVGLADKFEVTYTIQDVQNLQSINPGSFKDFQVLGGPYQSQNVSTQMVGNRMAHSVTYSITFVLKPKHTGSITIPAAVARDASGHSYQSNTIQLQVVPGSVGLRGQRQAQPRDPWGDEDPFALLQQQQAMMRQMQQQMFPQVPQGRTQPAVAGNKAEVGKDLFIKVDVDKRQARIGEQVTAVYKLYARIPMQVGISKLPSLNGFWTQDFDVPRNPKPTEEVVNGRKYQVFVLKKSALFPQQTGTLTLDAAEAEGSARVLSKRSNPVDDPFAAFGGSLMMGDPFGDDPFGDSGYEDVPVKLRSAPVTINVTELPQAGKPENFTGAVGNFTVASKIDKTTLTTDDIATLKLTVSGSGNLKLFDAPKMTVPDGIDSYDPHTFDTITGRSTVISGEKEISYTIAPHKAGDFQIPPVTISWYDVSTGTYKSASSPAYTIHVKEGKGSSNAVARGGKGHDIVDDVQVAAARPLVLTPLYWSMYALPLLALIGVTFYRKKEEEEEEDTSQNRNRKANRVAQKRLEAAGKMLASGNQRAFYDEISKAIWLYLSDKMGIPISSLGKAAATEALTKRGVPSPIQQQIDKVLGECELALYAPTSGAQQMQQTFSEAACIITGLERSLRA